MTRNTPTETPAQGTGKPSGPFPVPNGTSPYWRSELHPIDEHRSTETLPSACDIAIIGAGMSGVAMAYHLSQLADPTKPSASIVMLEARQVCSGATGRNGGHVKCKPISLYKIADKFGVDAAVESAKITQRTMYALKHVVETERLDCEFELRRTFDVFLSADEAVAVEKRFRECLEAGEAWTRDMDFVPESRAEQVTSMKGAKAALSGPACSLWPYKFVTQLLSRLLSCEGVDLNVQTNTPVARVSRHPNTSRTTIHTARGNLTANKVVFATNGYTAGILPQYTSVITPTKGTATHISPAQPLCIPHLTHTYNISYRAPTTTTERVDYLNPRPDGAIVVGGGNWTYNSNTDESSKWSDNYDDSTLIPPSTPNATLQHFDALMPTHFRGWGSSGAKVDGMWTGIMGYTPDGMPHVGQVPGMEGCWVLAGFNGGGMPLIFPCAEGVARMVLEGVGFEETGLPVFYEARKGRMST